MHVEDTGSSCSERSDDATEIRRLIRWMTHQVNRSGPRRLLGEYGGIEADRQTTSSRQQAAADS
eukprot:SAG25_NODE_34_length_20232_cov_4.725534_10_plen_64_part_00